MRLLDPFTRHPASVGETYGRHCVSAGRFALNLFAAGAACLVHAVFPFLFVKTGSALVTRLYHSMVANRHRTAATATDPAARRPKQASMA